MLGWLRPRPPLVAQEKALVETILLHLAEILGVGKLLDAKMALPTAEYFPEVADPALRDDEALKEKLCTYLGLDPRSVQLVVDAQQAGSSHETCESSCGPSCGDSTDEANDPQIWIAEMAHRLARRAVERAAGDAIPESQRAMYAELMMVYCGLGILSVNTTTARRAVPVRMVAYAMAVVSWYRHERRPSWSRHLSLDGQGLMSAAVRYLERTEDCLFHPSRVGQSHAAWSVNELTRRLKTGSPSARVATLWELARRGDAARDALPDVLHCFSARDAGVRAAAIPASVALGDDSEQVTTALVDLLHDGQAEVRRAAAHALGFLNRHPDLVLPELALRLEDDEPTVVRQAVSSLASYGPAAQIALDGLMRLFRSALVACDDGRVEEILAAIAAIAADRMAHLLDNWDEHDEDLRHVAEEHLERWKQGNPST